MFGNLLDKLTRSGGGGAPAPAAPRPQGSVEIDGQSCSLESWSFTGFLATEYDGVLSAGDHVPVRCHLELGDQSFEIACQAKLVRVDPESRKLVGAFFDMPPTVRAKMVRLFGGLLPD